MIGQPSGQYMTLRKLTGPPQERDIDATFHQAAEFLKNAGEDGLIQVRIVTRQKNLFWCLELKSGGCTVRRERVEHPDFEFITRQENWVRIAEGVYSPLEAVRDGTIKVRGDIDFGKRILKLLASSEGEIDICH